MKIRVSHLKDCLHTDHLLDSAAAFGFENPEEFSENIAVDCQIDSRGSDYYIKFAVKSKVKLVCDRCLAPFIFPINDQCSVLYTANEKLTSEDSEQVHLIQDGQAEIDVGPDIRETLMLSIPIKALCRDDCKGLCRCGQNLNIAACKCEEEIIDPRWAALAKLKKTE